MKIKNINDKVIIVMHMLYKKRLIYLRQEKNLKQYEMAKILKIAPTTYSNYESEYELISTRHLNTLCNYFNVSFDYIFEFTDCRKYNNMKKEINCKMAGQRLKEHRKKYKLNQTKFAETLAINQTTISVYELGKKIISLQYLYKICSEYGKSADYLLGKSDTPEYYK